MSHRQPPKYHKLLEYPLISLEQLNDLTLEQAAKIFVSADTYNLLEPKIICYNEWGCTPTLTISGFQKMSDIEIQKLKDANLKRSQAAAKRKAAIAQKEKETLIKLAKKYPEVVGYA